MVSLCLEYIDIMIVPVGLELLKEAIEKAGYTGKIEIGMDVAASEFYKDGKYDLDFKNKNSDPSKWVSNNYKWVGNILQILKIVIYPLVSFFNIIIGFEK